MTMYTVQDHNKICVDNLSGLQSKSSDVIFESILVLHPRSLVSLTQNSSFFDRKFNCATRNVIELYQSSSAPSYGVGSDILSVLSNQCSACYVIVLILITHLMETQGVPHTKVFKNVDHIPIFVTSFTILFTKKCNCYSKINP